MFNLLGSIFGYGQSSPSVATESQQSTCSNNNNTSNEEASQSTSGLVVASTTPTVNQSTQTQQTKVVDLTNSVAGATTNSQALSSNLNSSTTSPPADWVIVDRSEAAVEKCNKAAVDASTSMTASAMIDDLQKSTTVAPAPAVIAPVAATITNNITDSVMLGSFFDKNAAEDEEFNKKYGNAAAMHQTKDWLITPLPCLTSITASQRSIVDNDPMENLLIEHPSMSVFVAATSSAEDNDDDETATLENEDEEMNVVSVRILLNKQTNQIKCVKATFNYRCVRVAYSPISFFIFHQKKTKREPARFDNICLGLFLFSVFLFFVVVLRTRLANPRLILVLFSIRYKGGREEASFERS